MSMSKGFVQVLIILAVISLLGVGGFLYLKEKNVFKLTANTQPESSLESQKLKENLGEVKKYNDESGFSFNYFSKFSVEDATPLNSSVYYSLLEVSSKSYPEGKVTIGVKDTKYGSVADWLNKDLEAPPNTSLVGATSLAGFPAKQYSYEMNSQKYAKIAAIDKGILYEITYLADSPVFEELAGNITSSFTVESSSQSSSGSSPDDAVYETEEVVE